MNINIEEDDKFTIFYLIKNKEQPIEVKRENFNCLLSKILCNPDLKFLKKSILALQNKPNISVKDYSIDIFIFMKKPRYKIARFNKLYLQIKEKLIENEEFDKYYFPSSVESIGDFFIDTYTLFSKRIGWFITIFSIYFIYYYKISLEMIGFTDDIIEITYIFSILKLFTSVMLPLFIVTIPIIVFSMYISRGQENKIFLYNLLKGSIGSIICFILVYTVIFSHNIFQVKKENIKLDNEFLNFYISEKLYPRFIKNEDSFDLVLYKKRKELFYYSNNDLILNSKETCKQFKEKDFERIIISVLKNSNNIGSKFIDTITMNTKIKILDKNETFKKFKEICIKNKEP